MKQNQSLRFSATPATWQVLHSHVWQVTIVSGSAPLVVLYLIYFSNLYLSFFPLSNLSQQFNLVCIEAASPSPSVLLVIHLLYLFKLCNYNLRCIWTKQVWEQKQ